MSALICSKTYAQEADSDNIQLVTNKESNLLELIAIFNDAIDFPTKYNAYVKRYMQDATFPKKKISNKNNYDTLLKKWITENPSKIKKIIADRQKVHSELYGSRKK